MLKARISAAKIRVSAFKGVLSTKPFKTSLAKEFLSFYLPNFHGGSLTHRIALTRKRRKGHAVCDRILGVVCGEATADRPNTRSSAQQK